MTADNNIDISRYLENKPDDLKQITKKLMEIILHSNSGLSAEIRWGKPTFGLNRDFHHWICAVQILKNKVSLIFHFGGLLQDEKNILIAGSSRFLRKLEYDSLSSIDEAVIQDFIEQATQRLPYFRENWKELNAE